MNSLPSELTVFNMTVQVLWERITIPDANQATHACDEKQFYLAIPGIARFLALPEKNCIIIEKRRLKFLFTYSIHGYWVP